MSVEERPTVFCTIRSAAHVPPEPLDRIVLTKVFATKTLVPGTAKRPRPERHRRGRFIEVFSDHRYPGSRHILAGAEQGSYLRTSTKA